MSDSLARVLLLGIDAASPTLLEQWIADGTLPALRALAERGLTGQLRGVDGFFIGSTWPSFYTGTNPGRHGFHYPLNIVPGTYGLERRADAGERFVRQPSFWRVLSDAGRRVAVLDVPLSRLEPGLKGVQVVEWGGHDAVFGFEASSPELDEELRNDFGLHPLGTSCDAGRRSAAEYQAFVERLEAGVRLKGEWTRRLLARGGWDLFVQVFTEAHCAGHQCWHLHDVGHPAHDAALVSAIGDPLRRVYRAIDAAVGEIVDDASGATVIVFSAHGMDHWFGGQFLLEEILFRLGVTVPAPMTAGVRARLRNSAAQAWQYVPGSLRRPVRVAREILRKTAAAARSRAGLPKLAFDFTRSQCFPVNNGLAVGGIRLNIAGREPTGVLQPGADAESFVERLRVALLEIVDERTGARIVRQVHRVNDLAHGDLVDELPDLLVEWNDETATGSALIGGGVGARVRVTSPRIGIVEGINEYGRSGEHRRDGWFVAAGKGLAAGRLAQPVSLMDLAPTVTRLLGVEMPGVDGRVAFGPGN